MNILQDPDSSIIKALRGKGYKATPQRIAIDRFLLHNNAHPTGQRIYSEDKKVYPAVSLTTIYKTVQILKEAGLIRELNLEKDQARFDPNMKPHAHLVCLQCKRRCVASVSIPKYDNKPRINTDAHRCTPMHTDGFNPCLSVSICGSFG